MSRRPVNSFRRYGDAGGASLFSQSKSRSPPFLAIVLIVLVTFPAHLRFNGRLPIPILKKAYGDSMHKVLHVGPDTCSVVSNLLKEDKTEAWGALKSLPLVIVSDTLDYLSPRYLNKTLPDFARVTADGVVVFTGFPGQRKAKAAEMSKYGRAAKLRSLSWWARYFDQTSLEENEVAAKKFSQAAEKNSYSPSCQIVHLRSYH
ncbi:hypothetical protein REPUB_Repub02eG0065400 [Reevesia pubescens]